MRDRSFHRIMDQKLKFPLRISLSVYALGVCVFLNSFSGMINDFVMIRYLSNRFGRGAEAFGLMIAMYFIGKIISLFFVGKLSDIFGRKIVLVWVFSFYLIGSIFAPLAPTYFWFSIGRLIKGFASYESVGLALINDLIPKSSRNKMISFFNISIVSGYLIGGLIAGFFLIWFPDLTNFWILVGINAISLIIVIFYIKDASKLDMKFEEEEIAVEMINPQDASSSTPQESDILHRFQLDFSYFKIPTYLMSTIIALFFGIAFTGSSTVFTYLILNSYNIQPEWIRGWMIQIVNLTISVTIYLMGKRKDSAKNIRISSRWLLILYPLNFILLWTQILPVFMILMLFQSFLLAIIIPSLDSWVSGIIYDKSRGESLGFYKVMYFLGSAIGSTLYGYLGEFAWEFSPFLWNGIIFGILFILIQFKWKTNQKTV